MPGSSGRPATLNSTAGVPVPLLPGVVGVINFALESFMLRLF